ncbi:hypothetical protein pneo_cds_749 [Pandoravirus neocaledonia]|uniref:Uncharacterized protein n=1 Tax=Pandoravirus neocaledonia TaxID=2107708 RepID=A0A2U7UD48_9VIRU|nr:hypothetical protein pneo_cds_749 [Pandoravirus neocaledonia]AVK76356.1 hypothetical protein pneo_cds_749 [Pandoravirus neocaledonia]
MDIIAPIRPTKMTPPAVRIPRDIAALFAACAVPGLVDLDADPKTVPTGALFPCEAAPSSAVTGPDCRKQAESGRARSGPREFDRSTHRSGSNNLITGNLRSGKTVLLKDLLCLDGNRWDVVVAMCPALESRDALRDMFPASCVHDKYDPVVINKIISTARALRETGFQPRVLLVLDDCMLDRQCNHKEMRDLYLNSHYLGIEVYNVAPYAVDMAEALRFKVDYAFITHEPRQACRVALYKSFGTVFPTCEEFLTALDTCTDNFGCMVVDNARASSAIADRIFCDQGSLGSLGVPLGSHAQWLLHYMFYKEPKHDAVEISLDDPIPTLTRLGLVD